ncbi:MAG: hypothetical protein DMD82_12220 [Candidatus Rokuibacteriota bacterium]|nr:MAG: hypothetical protein DMD82_12220 [Candidatus Rokubacteria bacterium]
MEYTVQYGDTLWEIAEKFLANPTRWREIARLNWLRDPDILLIGQRLQLPAGAKLPPVAQLRIVQQQQPLLSLGTPAEQRPATAVPARAFLFVLADEINPFTRTVVRKVVFPKHLQDNPELLKRILDPERYGFSPRDPLSKVSLGRHVLGRTDSKYISAGERPLGSPRIEAPRFWIDIEKVRRSGGIIHEADEIARDLERIAAKAKDAKFLHYIEDIRHRSLIIDKEVVIEGWVPAAAVKGATAMALTRGLQVVQGVGIVMSAYDLGRAGVQSHQQGSVRPIAAESIRQVGGWASAIVGLKLGAATGGLFGIETGPGAVVTAAVGGLIGGVAGYFSFDWIADYIHEN